MVKSIAQSHRCQLELYHCNKLVLIPWRDDMNALNEFRCFIHNGRLTAMSVYNYREYGSRKWSLKPELEIRMIVKNVCEKWNQLEPDAPWNSCVMDVHVSRDLKVEVIEFNPFGAQSMTGSSMFHWIQDYDQLHGKTDIIEVRLVQVHTHQKL